MELGDSRCGSEPLDRRDWLRAMLLGAASAGLPGCGARDWTPPPGEWIGEGAAIGHRLRDGQPPAAGAPDWRELDVVIVGAGVAGLAAARRLERAGRRDFVVLELGDVVGGTARAGQRDGFRFPWGAHYLPLPQADNRLLVDLLRECDVLEPSDGGEVAAREEMLCRDPQERLLAGGVWYEDLDVWHDAPEDELRQWRAWQAEIERWTKWRDAKGRRAFALPTREASDAPEIRALDQITMGQWLADRGWNSSRLRWLIDYACRDDYGMTVEQVSAWAGLFYFCARMPEHESRSQPLLTWPEGNGWLVKHMSSLLGDRVHTETPVWSIRPSTDPNGRIEVVAGGVAGREVQAYRARRVVCAVPQFIASRMIQSIDGARTELARHFEYGSWLVANVFLRDRPRGRGFPLAWDNMSVDSRSLGYVVATHQLGVDHGPTVFTWYHAFCDDDVKAARQRLFDLSRDDAARLVAADLQSMHPEIGDLISRIDLVRWGHAMVRPRPGFRTSAARTHAAQPWRGIHFAHTELSGVALFEEAFDQGERAAAEVLQSLE
ncbi:MAG: FAD-dependent oxidoreductase [Pirellulales bacterium]